MWIHPRTGCINSLRRWRDIPPGLKPAVYAPFAARLKPCPFKTPFVQPVLARPFLCSEADLPRRTLGVYLSQAEARAEPRRCQPQPRTPAGSPAKYEGARSRSSWRLRCGDHAGQSDSPPASRLATCSRLAPFAPLFARLARMPPACTGCPPSSSRRRAIPRLLSEATPSSSAFRSHPRLAPRIESSRPASDRSPGFHRARYLPATPLDRLRTCARAFFLRCG
jgi:hypothetical protein